MPVAQSNLAPYGGRVVESALLPFRAGAFDLVVSRHPVRTDWPAIARVLRDGGVYLSQQIGAGSNRAGRDGHVL